MYLLVQFTDWQQELKTEKAKDDNYAHPREGALSSLLG
jgi:hypothetical protein